MKKSILCLAALIMPNLAVAETNYYISPQVGISIPNKTAKFGPFPRDFSQPAITKERFKSSVVYDITVGRKVYKNTFIELEAAYASSHQFKKSALIDFYSPITMLTKTKLETRSIFANVNYQFKDILPMSIVPYVTGGLGCSSNRIKSATMGTPEANFFTISGKTTNNFAWQLGAGVLLSATKNIDVNLSYKF